MNHPDPRHSAGPTFAPQGPDAYSSAGPGGGPPVPPANPPQPKQKSWFARHKILTTLLIAIALIIIGSAVGGGDDDVSSGTSSGTTTDQDGGGDAGGDGDDAAVDAAADEAADDAGDVDAAEPAESAPGVGDAVRDGKFEFTVTEVETGVSEVGDDFLGEEAQGQFVLVHMTVSNIGDEAQMLSGSNQTLVDTQGREHSANTSAAIYLDGSGTFLNDINPGNSVDGVVVFDIPADAEPASIELHDSVFSGGVTVSLAP